MMALKKLFAVALAVALPAAALAQAAAPAPAAAPATPAPAPLVQVYGTLNVNLQYTGAESATNTAQNVKPRLGLGLDSSNIGVKGTVDVVGGLKVTYQCETSANIDGEGVSGICNRNSRAGIMGDFGTIWYGNWDTPYKAGTYGTNADDPFGNTDVYGHANIMGSPGYGTRSSNIGNAAGTTAAFDNRGGNSVGYWSPKFAGLSAKLQFSLDEFATASGTNHPIMAAGALNYDWSGLSVVAQAEYHEDYFGIRVLNAGNVDNSGTKDLALRLAAGYAVPLGEGSTLTLIGWFESLKYEQANSTVAWKSYTRLAWLVGAKYRMGDHEFRARYSAALKPDIKSATSTPIAATAEDDLEAQNLVVGYAYSLAKTTQLYLYYSQITNQPRARYTFGVGGVAAVVAANTPAGSDPSAFGLGIRHSF